MSNEDDLKQCLQPSDYLDSDHPLVVEQSTRLTAGCVTDADKVGKIYRFVRDLPYDIFNSFRYLAEGKHRASDVLQAGHAFCMGKASAFVSLCRAAGVPARIGFQELHCPDKEFMSEEVRQLWRDRPLPWHSLGEAYLGGAWLKLDATIPAEVARQKGKPYIRDFDGINHIPTVEGPIVKEIGSFPDYPSDVADWYATMARETMAALGSSTAKEQTAGDDAFWSGPAHSTVKSNR
jgi:transglutaminase-like putative cysteine protease